MKRLGSETTGLKTKKKTKIHYVTLVAGKCSKGMQLQRSRISWRLSIVRLHPGDNVKAWNKREKFAVRNAKLPTFIVVPTALDIQVHRSRMPNYTKKSTVWLEIRRSSHRTLHDFWFIAVSILAIHEILQVWRRRSICCFVSFFRTTRFI